MISSPVGRPTDVAFIDECVARRCDPVPNDAMVDASVALEALVTKGSLHTAVVLNSMTAHKIGESPNGAVAFAKVALGSWLSVDGAVLEPLFQTVNGPVRNAVVVADELLIDPLCLLAHLPLLRPDRLDRLSRVLLVAAFLDAGSVALPRMLYAHASTLSEASSEQFEQPASLYHCVCIPTGRFASVQLQACIAALGAGQRGA